MSYKTNLQSNNNELQEILTTIQELPASSDVSSSSIETHNTDTTAHADIREQITALSDELPNNEVLITNVAEVVKAEVPLIKVAEQPTFVQSADDMADTSKVYLQSDGYLYAWGKGSNITKLTADDFETGTVDSNGVPSGSGASKVRCYTKNTLSLNDGTISVHCPTGYGFIVYFYKASTASSANLVAKTTWNSSSLDDLTTISLTSGSLASATHCRISFRYGDGSSVITSYVDALLANDPIVISSIGKEQWLNTGLAYNQPIDYEERIIALEQMVAELSTKLN